MNNNLKLAVIGEPNKGKSSFVSTLAYDDGISVSSESGETKKFSCHALKIENKTVYELYDTPGFNNDEEVLNYINENEKSFIHINDLIMNLIKEKIDDKAYSKDIEILKVLILKPILLYIVDSSKEYNSSFDCSLEIIKKLKLPSFIVYNQHDQNKDEEETWKDIENKYFISSFKYNVLDSSFNNKIDLLDTLKKNILDQTKKIQLCESIKTLNKDFERRLKFSYEELCDRFYKIINHAKEYKENNFSRTNIEKKQLEFIQEIKNQEKSFYSLIEKEWGFNNLEKHKEVNELKELEIDTTSTEEILGAKKETLKKMGMIIGGIIGAGLGMNIDLLGGMGMGTLLGTIGGGWFGYATIQGGTSFIKSKTKGFGVNKITVMELSDITIRLIILAKMYLFVELISKRSHAKRDKFNFNFKESKNLFNVIFQEKYYIRIAKILYEKDKDKFTKELVEILIDNYYERNNINFKETKCN